MEGRIGVLIGLENRDGDESSRRGSTPLPSVTTGSDQVTAGKAFNSHSLGRMRVRRSSPSYGFIPCAGPHRGIG